MEKPADAKYPINDLIKRRWSPRAFSAKMVEPEALQSLMEAARWAPSSFNEQPWSFIIATKADQIEYDRLLKCLVEFNQSWAKAAPVLMLSIARLNFEKNGKENRHAFHDVGLAAENLTIQAASLGLVVHQMAGFDLDKARETYHIPHSHSPVAAIAIGYPGDAQSLSEEIRKMESAPRTRKPLANFVFSQEWEMVPMWISL